MKLTQPDKLQSLFRATARDGFSKVKNPDHLNPIDKLAQGIRQMARETCGSTKSWFREKCTPSSARSRRINESARRIPRHTNPSQFL